MTKFRPLSLLSMVKNAIFYLILADVKKKA